MIVNKSSTALALLALAFNSLANPIHRAASDSSPTPTISSNRAEAFQRLLSLVEPDSLHDALRAWHPKWADGAFASDKSAAEAIHRESPALATVILELARRQDGPAENDMARRDPPNSTSAALPTDSQQASTSIQTVTATPTNVVVVQTSTEPAQSSSASAISQPVTTPVASTSSAAVPTSSVVIKPTQTSVQQTSVAPQSTSSPPMSVAPSTTANAPQSSNGADTGVDVSTSVYLTTFTPSQGGPPSTITAVTVVGVPGRSGQSAGAASAAGTSQPSGSLRNAGTASRPSIVASVLAAAGVALHIVYGAL